MLSVYLTNLAKYNAGKLVGKWIELPMDEDQLKEEVQAVLGEGEEYFITDYESDYELRLSEYEDVYILNERIAKFLEVAEEYDDKVIIAAFKYLVEFNDVYNCLKDHNLNVFYNVYSATELGYAVVEEGLFEINIPEELKGYIDFESIGEEWECSGTVIYEDLGIAVRFY